MTAVVVAAVVVLVVAVTIPIVSYNRFVAQRHEIAAAWATVDAELDRRHRLVPMLVDTVRAAAAHERDLLVHAVEAEARAHAVRSDPAMLTRADPPARTAIARLVALRESSPQLTSDAVFRDLQRQLAMVEDRIAAARRFYNTRVVALNERVESFPSNLVARVGGFEKAPYFGTDR
jgi:LemA protein